MRVVPPFSQGLPTAWRVPEPNGMILSPRTDPKSNRTQFGRGTCGAESVACVLLQRGQRASQTARPWMGV